MDDGSDAQRYITMTNESDPIEYTLKFTDVSRSKVHKNVLSITTGRLKKVPHETTIFFKYENNKI